MNISALARSLGISRQMVYKSRDQGMPTDSLESALAWRKRNIDPFRSKRGRIGGNTGVKHQPKKINKSMSYADVVSMVDELDEHEYKIAKKNVNPCGTGYLVYSNSPFRYRFKGSQHYDISGRFS